MSAWHLPMLVAAVLAFWAVGATRRLRQLRAVVQSRFQTYDEHLRQQDALLATLLSESSSMQPGDDAAACQQLLAASRQACAAASLLRDDARSEGPVRGLQLAEEILNNAMTAASPTLDDLARTRAERAPEVEALRAHLQHLAVARLAFDAASRAYNAAVAQFPTRLLAAVAGYRPAALLSSPTEHAAERKPQRVQS